MKLLGILLSALLPLAGIAALLFVASHHTFEAPADAGGPDTVQGVSLLTPDARVSAAQAILLRNQYRYYLRLNSVYTEAGRRQNAIQEYNLSSAECSSRVFQQTHLPRSVK